MTSTTHHLSGPNSVPIQQPLPPTQQNPGVNCGFASALTGSLPYQQLCVTETCQNRLLCPKTHLSLFTFNNPGLFQPPPALNPQIPMFPSNSGLNHAGIVQNPAFGLVSSLPQAPVPSVNPNLVTDPRDSWKDTLRLAISARQLQKQTALLQQQDSGNDSGVETESSPSKNHQILPSSAHGGVNQEGSRGSSASPKSSHDGSSSGYKSPHSVPGLLASILRGDDGHQSSSGGSGGSSPVEKHPELSPPTDFDSEGSKSPRELAQLKPAQSSGFSMNQILGNVAQTEPERTSAVYTPPYLAPHINKLSNFGISNTTAGFMPQTLPPLASVAPFLSGISPEQQMRLFPSQQPFVQFPSSGNSAFQPFQQYLGAQTSTPSVPEWRNEAKSQKLEHSASYPNLFQPVSVNTAMSAKSEQSLVSREASPSSSTTHSSSPCSTTASLSQNLAGAVCVVCEDDKASGYHYGVISCEGCKGFFRRSVQKNMEYNCHKDGTCSVNRVTRNRCQACRFNKCLRTGMAKESVRQDRNRKRKAKDEKEEAELKETARLQRTIQTVVSAHQETCSLFPLDKPVPSVAGYLKDQLLAFDEAAQRVTEFSVRIPGFNNLSAPDRGILFSSAFLEIFLLRTAFLYCGRDLNSIDFTSGLMDPEMSLLNMRDMVDCVRKLRDSFIQLEVSNEEIALLSAVCLLCPTRVGLLNVELVESAQEPLLEGLRVQVQLRRHQYQNVFAKLLMKISDLRTVALRESAQLRKLHQARTVQKEETNSC